MIGNITLFMTDTECRRIYHEIKKKSPKDYSEREEITVYRHTQKIQREKRWTDEHRRNEESCCCEVGYNEPAVISFDFRFHYCKRHRPLCIIPKCNRVRRSHSKNRYLRCHCCSMLCRHKSGCDKKVVLGSRMCSFHSNICTLDKCDKVVTGLFNGKPLFCQYHCHQARIMEKWGRLTCSKKGCLQKIDTVASGLCRLH